MPKALARLPSGGGAGKPIDPMGSGTSDRPGTDEMKVMMRKSAKGFSAYVPKKDLEEPVVEQEKEALWGGWVKLRNGWVLDLPEMAADTRLPITVVAKKRGGEDD